MHIRRRSEAIKAAQINQRTRQKSMQVEASSKPAFKIV